VRCPRCGKSMNERDFGGVQVDVCESGCRGLWLEWSELADVDEPNDGFGRDFEAAVSASSVTPRTGRIQCTICKMPMHEHLNGSGSHVLIDECYGCRGFFLDPGELQAIRDEIAQSQERDRKIEELLLNDPVWRAHLMERKADVQFTQAAVKMRDLLMQRVPWWAQLWASLP
jgi:Zn-finger nucleic acid-binding protein